MIILFEGPRLAGKTTLIKHLRRVLIVHGYPAKVWKDTRGKDPIADMNIILDDGIFTNDFIWLLDRFHLSEWANSTYSRKEEYSDTMWFLFEEEIRQIDKRLQELDTLIILVIAPPWEIDKRNRVLKREDLAGDSKTSLDRWFNMSFESNCDMLYVANMKLDQLVEMLASTIIARWKGGQG